MKIDDVYLLYMKGLFWPPRLGGAMAPCPPPLRTRLARAEWALHALPNTEEQSLRDEVWRCPVGKSSFEPERSEQREAAKLNCDTSAPSSCH